MNTQDKIKVMQHHADGGAVEFRAKISSETSNWEYSKNTELAWNWGVMEYRIAIPKKKYRVWLAPGGFPFVQLEDGGLSQRYNTKTNITFEI